MIELTSIPHHYIHLLSINPLHPFPYSHPSIHPLHFLSLKKIKTFFLFSSQNPILNKFRFWVLFGFQENQNMMLQKEDLGLSLSLNFPQIHPSSSSPSGLNHQKSQWNESIHRIEDTRSEFYSPEMKLKSFLRGIDVNRIPATAECEEEGGVSSPNSTISSVSGKRSERDCNGEENACSRGISDEEDGENSRKKLRLSKDQAAVLEETFKEHNTLNPKQKLALAKKLGLRPRQVEVWFQNRRARTKLKQTEVDCEFLKRCCEKLSDENRRLQKEVQELRALKMSPQFFMTPPTTLTMCPSCERVGVPPSASSVSAHQMVSSAHRSNPFNPWAASAAAIPHTSLPFDVLRPHS